MPVHIEGGVTLDLGPIFDVVFRLAPFVVGAYVLFRVVPAYQRRNPRRPSGPPVPYPVVSAEWAYVGSDPGLIDRLGLGYEGMPGRIVATDVRVREVDGYLVLAAVVPERVWIDDRKNKPFIRLGGVGVAGTHTLCALTLPGSLPSFNLVSEGRLGKVASAVGMRDLDTESAEFNDRRRVLAYDDRTGHALLAPHVVALLLDGPPDATLQIMGNQLVSFRRGPFDASEVDARLAWMVRVARAIPAFVYTDRG